MTNFGRPFRASATGQREALPRRFNTGDVDDVMLRSRIQSGHRISSSHRDALDALERLMLDVGEPVWAFASTAAALHRFDEFVLRPPFHLLIPRGRHVNRIGHVIHTTVDIDPIDRETVGGFPVTSPARTIIDLARHSTPGLVTGALDSAFRDGGTTENHLHTRIAALRTKGRHGMPQLLRLIEGAEITRGGHSWLERRFLELVASADLPRPQTQQILTKARDRLVRVDIRFAGSPIVVEVLGYRFHRTRDQMQRDAERMNRLLLDGFIVLQFTYLDVTEHPDWVLAQVREALALHAPALCVSTHANLWRVR